MQNKGQRGWATFQFVHHKVAADLCHVSTGVRQHPGVVLLAGVSLLAELGKQGRTLLLAAADDLREHRLDAVLLLLLDSFAFT